MVKATNPHTGKSEIVTAEQAAKMQKSIALKGYQYEVLQVEAPAEPPTVNVPELPAPASPAEEQESQADEIPVGIFNTPFGDEEVTKPAKRRKS